MGLSAYFIKTEEFSYPRLSRERLCTTIGLHKLQFFVVHVYRIIVIVLFNALGCVYRWVSALGV